MPAPIAGAFALLVARLFQFAYTKVGPTLVARAGALSGGRAGAISIGLTGGAVAADLINIDELRREAVKLAPNSDPEALEEAARQVMRMVGADGSDVQFPSNGPPKYFMMNMQNGQMWFTTRYNSSKTVRAAARRGAGRGFGRGQRSIATISQAQRG